ncbi:type VI secretion system protein ImpK [Pseudoduganella flava]|uniref:DotU family type IV/VI secretion system protein n=1 Tax=Pseudoduganella flava TaxID=871742 RepID=A0A562PHX3_9BURK|nr:DotU family type IV/VI secretion system protein [Pseudoduganella flava]QGZ42665.1 DotU family type IV/VI secretion system protein [Pseudoduganella flava]TWI43830.1 type VI secretion system protein ImpK [Pseudoduganella flava]
MTNQSNERAAAGRDDLASSQFRHFAAVLAQAAQAATRLGEHEAQAGAEALSRQLVQLIELHTLEAGRQGGKAGLDAELQARFVKAALADEVLLHTDWAGRQHWQHVLLEATLFNTAYAGQQVFADIEQLLRERDAGRRGVARLYLHLLSLGFQGRYRGSADLGPIAACRRELFQLIYQRPADLGGRDAVLAEQPYASTLTYGGGRRLPKLSRRGVMLAVALLLLLGVSELLWLWQSWPVRDAVDAPLAQLASVAAPGRAAWETASC